MANFVHFPVVLRWFSCLDILNIQPDCVGPAQAAGDLPEAIMAVDRNIIFDV